eukprot:6192731-Karenia_brevis.AAC.1
MGMNGGCGSGGHGGTTSLFDDYDMYAEHPEHDQEIGVRKLSTKSAASASVLKASFTAQGPGPAPRDWAHVH